MIYFLVMKSKRKQKSETSIISNFIPFIALFITTAAVFFLIKTSIFQIPDFRIFDSIIHHAKEIDSEESIVLIDIDDDSLNHTGEWPWSRITVGNMLLRLKEFGNRQTILDSEFYYPSETSESDDYFKRCIQFSGNTIMSINSSRNPSDVQKNFITYSSSFGYRNTPGDCDGTVRRIRLFDSDGKIATNHLILSSLQKLWDIQSITKDKNFIVLEGCKKAGQDERSTIRIPLDDNGNMIIKWLHKNSRNSFRHVSACKLVELDMLEKQILDSLAEVTPENLKKLAEDDADYIMNTYYFITEYNSLVQNRQRLLEKCKGFSTDGTAIDGGLNNSHYNIYFFARKDFFHNLKDFSDSIKNIQYAEKVPQVERLISSVEKYVAVEESLRKEISGSLCIIGNTSSFSMDFSNTPFNTNCPLNVIHGNSLNTILQQKFSREFPEHWGLAFSFAFIFAILIATHKMNAIGKNIISLSYIIIPGVAFILIPLLTDFYFPASAAMALCIVTYLIETAISIRKHFHGIKKLETNFESCFGNETIDKIKKNPSAIKLSGEKRSVTVLSSGIRNFSSIQNSMKDEMLFSMLNRHISCMSSKIKSHEGTVDRVHGDETSAFFGAPCEDMENAFHACLCAIRMIEAEKAFNEENGLPQQIQSFIGINSSNISTGCLGTEKKQNYTIIGDDAKLASKLRNANKNYGSRIICSEETWKQADSGIHKGEIIARQLDCILLPSGEKIQIYSIIGLKSEMDEMNIKAAALFNEGMKFYLSGFNTPEKTKSSDELKTAYAYFKKSRDCCPTDKSSEIFMKRCAQYIKKGTPDFWDSVYTIRSKQ